VVDQSDAECSAIRELVQDNPELIKWHRVGFRGLPRARNYGWQHASNKAVIFVDDDIRCGPELVAQHVRALCLPNVGVVAGGIDELRAEALVPGRTGVFDWWRAIPFRYFNATGERDVEHAQGCNFSTWQHILASLGGIDEQFQIGAALYEETDFCLRGRRAGYRVYFNGHARLKHLGTPIGGCRVQDIQRYIHGLAHNRAILIRRHLHWYQRPTALLELARLAIAHAIVYREPAVLMKSLDGCLAGLKVGKRAPICTTEP
jgi:GT2 family glycosyltransferase